MVCEWADMVSRLLCVVQPCLMLWHCEQSVALSLPFFARLCSSADRMFEGRVSGGLSVCVALSWERWMLVMVHLLCLMCAMRGYKSV